jgi:hypothetical protein
VRAILAIHSACDVMAAAQTGSGKTAAFALAKLQRLMGFVSSLPKPGGRSRWFRPASLLRRRSFTMRPDLREIVREFSTASNLGEMLAIIVRRVKCCLPVDICGVYLTGVEADQSVLMATDGSSAAPVGQGRAGP